MRAGVSFSVHLCSASLSKGTLGGLPDLRPRPLTRASSVKLCFQCGPTKRSVGGMISLRSLFLAPVTVSEQLEQLLQKGPVDQSRRERASDVLFI